MPYVMKNTLECLQYAAKDQERKPLGQYSYAITNAWGV